MQGARYIKDVVLSEGAARVAYQTASFRVNDAYNHHPICITTVERLLADHREPKTDAQRELLRTAEYYRTLNIDYILIFPDTVVPE